MGLKVKEDDLLAETIAECGEQLDKTILILLDIEKSGFLFRHENYNEIFRTLHSIKGCLAMVGMANESELIHQCESLFKKCLDDSQFHTGIIQITIEFLGNLQDAFLGNSVGVQNLEKASSCFACVEKQNYKKLCPSHSGEDQTTQSLQTVSILRTEQDLKKECPLPEIMPKLQSKAVQHNDQPLQKILFVGENSELIGLLQTRHVVFTSMTSPDAVYLAGKKLNAVKIFIVDLKSCCPNPLLFIRVINNLFPSKEVYLIANELLLDFKNVPDPDKLNFVFLGTRSKNFDTIIRKIISEQ